jgi:tripartite-type tricarboxylate transporter receptor subunit TctC
MTNRARRHGAGKTPREVVAKLNGEINKIMGLPEQKAKLEEVGTQLDPISTEQFTKFLASEIASYAKPVKASGSPSSSDR